MLPANDRLKICFAHAAYRMAELFARLNSRSFGMETSGVAHAAQNLTISPLTISPQLW